jgi:hypothetical protein
LCVATFTNFLEKIVEWRSKYGFKVRFDTPYLKEPPHWEPRILTPDFLEDMDKNLKFITDRPDQFGKHEYEKMKRVRDYMHENINKGVISSNKYDAGRRDFYSFFTENDKRLGTDLLKTFPRYEEFYHRCKQVYENYDK